jgi:hypothetical protein
MKNKIIILLLSITFSNSILTAKDSFKNSKELEEYITQKVNKRIAEEKSLYAEQLKNIDKKDRKSQLEIEKEHYFKRYKIFEKEIDKIDKGIEQGKPHYEALRDLCNDMIAHSQNNWGKYWEKSLELKDIIESEKDRQEMNDFYETNRDTGIDLNQFE